MRGKVWPLALFLALLACRDSETQVFPHHQNSDALPPDAEAQASDLTAEQVLAKYDAARGGLQKLKGIHFVKMTGTWKTNSQGPSQVTVMIAPGRYLRRIGQGSSSLMIKAVDNQKAWEITPQQGIVKPKSMAAKDAPRFRHLADPQGPLVDPAAKGNKVEVVGKLPWRSSQVYKLKVTFPDGGADYFYLDARSFLPVRVMTSMYSFQYDRDIKLELTYEDFRDVGGVKWPFLEKANAPEGKLTQAITWEQVEVNQQPVNEATFKPPQG